jgi:quinol monooxygenase YgiN
MRIVLLGHLNQLARRGDDMAVRLVVTITAAPGKGSELAQVYKARCEECMKEPGCEQFEVFQSALNPDRLALLERWSDQAALDTHAKLNATRAALRPELRAGGGEREDYEYKRTR